MHGYRGLYGFFRTRQVFLFLYPNNYKLVLELALRALSVAKANRSIFVEVEHVEKILAQLLLDF